MINNVNKPGKHNSGEPEVASLEAFVLQKLWQAEESLKLSRRAVDQRRMVSFPQLKHYKRARVYPLVDRIPARA